MKETVQKLFFGGPSKWYLGGVITDESRAAIVEWLEDRWKFHVWLTSLATGAIVFLATLAPEPGINPKTDLIRLCGLGLTLFSVLANIVCVWSISNYKLNVKVGGVMDGAQLRLDIETVAVLATASFIIGLGSTVITFII